MARYSLGQRTVDGTTGAAAWELIAGAQGVLVVEISATLVAATATTLGLGRPAAAGITPTTPITFKDEGSASAVALTKGAMAWGTGPTVPAAFYRRIGLLATIGTGVKWTFEKGLFVPASATLVLWNLASNSLLDVYAVIEE